MCVCACTTVHSDYCCCQAEKMGVWFFYVPSTATLENCLWIKVLPFSPVSTKQREKENLYRCDAKHQTECRGLCPSYQVKGQTSAQSLPYNSSKNTNSPFLLQRNELWGGGGDQTSAFSMRWNPAGAWKTIFHFIVQHLCRQVWYQQFLMNKWEL